MSESNTNTAGRDGHTDFDFFIGHWTVLNRRLRAPLQGSQS